MSVRPPRSLSHSLKHQVHSVPRYLTLLLLILLLGLAVSGPLVGQFWDVGSAAREPQRVTSGAESLAFAAPVNPINVENEPTLGNYPNTSVQLGGSTTITPDAAPTNTTGINVSTSTSFNGKLAADPVTGVVRVTNAHPAASFAPGFYTVTVKAFSSGGATTTRTFTLTVDAGIVCAGSVFTNAPDVSMGNDASSVAIGDFNNDGKQDLAVANYDSHTVSIRLGDGLGGFSGTTQVNVGSAYNSYAASVAIGDFNNDGNQDLAVAVWNGSNQVSIRLGDGLGGFSGTTEVPVSAHSVTIGDFNNDGKQDLAITNSGVSIRLGDGAGNFSGTTEVSVSDPSSIALGDFNNDGNQDIAAACPADKAVSIRLGDGLGGFSGTMNVPVGTYPQAVAIGDFNNDGKQDLATANDNPDTASIRFGDGLGGFGGTTEVSVGRWPGSIAIGDFNNDGNQDIAVSSGSTRIVSIRLGDGAGGFSGTMNVPVDSAASVAIGDFNNDGKQDFVTAKSSVSIRLGHCNLRPTIAAATGLSRAQGAPASNSQIATVTDDGGNGNVAVTVTSPTINGVTISNIVNTGGNITADISASCAASNATFTLQASDGSSTATDTLTVTTANTGPCLSYASPQSVHFGGALNVTPTAAHGTITGYAVTSVTPVLTTAPTVDSSGRVSITNAQPPGQHTVTIRATDTSGAITDANFRLMVQAPPCTGATFASAGEVSAPQSPYSIAIGDFNNDGNQDFATNGNSHTVSIRLGNGLGGFSGPTQVNVGGPAGSSVAGDFNKDGNQDLAVLTPISSIVSIRLGDGAGGFSGTTEVAVGSHPGSIAIGDFNNDGKQDFATANQDSTTVSIRLGDGMGGFTGTTEVSVGAIPAFSSPNSIAIGDFNNNGNQDIAVASIGSGTVSIRLGDGMGGFSGTTNVNVGAQPKSIAIGDFNNDGNQDFATATNDALNSNAGRVSVGFGDGAGGFSSTKNVAVGSYPQAVAIGDFNNDGNQDFAAANMGSNTVSIRLGNGSGGFSSTTNVAVGQRPISVAIGDFNNDGKLDFASGNDQFVDAPTVSIRLGQCNFLPTIVATTGLSLPQGSVSNSQIATVTDDGGDGNVAVTVKSANPSNGVTLSHIVNTGGKITADIAASACGASNATFTLQASDGIATATDTLTVTVTARTPPCLMYASPQSVSFGGALNVTPTAAAATITGYAVQSVTPALTTAPTVNSSGIVSITTAQPPGLHTITIRATDNSGAITDASFRLMVQAPACTGASSFTNAADVSMDSAPQFVAVGDFNNDGNQDLATAKTNLNTVSIRLGDGLGGFSGTTEVAVGSHPGSVAIGDFNHDGNQDIAVANIDSGTVSIRLGDGLGGFSGTTEVAVGSFPYSVAIGDFNKDSKQDFATANEQSSIVSIRLGDGAGGFSGTTEVAVGAHPRSIAIGDFNNDGKQDFLTANNITLTGNNTTYGTVSVRLGNGLGGFSGTTNVAVGSMPAAIAIGDFNHDGWPDFATANYGSNTVSIRMGSESVGGGGPNGDPIWAGFSATLNVAVGSYPRAVAIGDFNNDGNQDFATANDGSGTVSIRLGNGAGGFSGTTEVSVGSNPYSLTIGDFNNDGKPDFATANAGSNTVAIRLGHCNPTPRITATIGLSRPQGSVSNSQIATVTDDGGNGNVAVTVTSANPLNGVTISNIVNTAGNITADIAASCATSNAAFTLQASDGVSTSTATLTVTVTANPAQCLTYASPQSVNFGGALNVNPTAAVGIITSCAVQRVVPALTTAPTVNSSGVVSITNAQPMGPHIITIRATDNGGAITDSSFTLMVQPAAGACAGASTFTNAADVGVGTNPAATAIGDFNNDGKQDLAVSNSSSKTISIRLGDGLGGFSGTTEVSVGGSASSVAIGDFNHDGNQDIATTNPNSNRVSIRLGDGLGGFTGTTEVDVGGQTSSNCINPSQGLTDLVLGDFNNDGNQDFTVVRFYKTSFWSSRLDCWEYTHYSVLIRLGDGAGHFSGTTEVSVGSFASSVAIGDFNNDGKQDLAVSNYGSGTISIRLGDGLGHFSGTTEVGVVGSASSVAIGDFNNDGNQDFAVPHLDASTVSIRLGDGAGHFGGTTEVAVVGNVRSIAIGDFNNDGKQDLAFTHQSSNTVGILLGDGAGHFSGTTEVAVGGSASSLAIGDFNNDGKQDIAANSGSNTVSIRLGHCDPIPTIAAATGLSRQQGTPASNSQIATVTDDGGNGSVAVTVTSANPSNGVTISNIVNTAGNITADIVASCSATNASFTLQASDGISSATDTLNITVTANTAPILNYSDPPSVTFNGSLNVTPTTASDNGSITGYAVQGVVPALTTAPTVNASGVVSITNAQPVGPHAITIRSTDNCGAVTDASFTLNVANGNQTITFDALANKTLGDPDFALSATASSGLPVSFSASGQCTVAVNTVHLTGAGSCTITASQDGDSSFNPAAEVAQSFTIANRALISFSQSNYDVDESADFVTITVNRTGDLSVPAEVEYATDDTGSPIGCGTLNSVMASARCDFGLTMGALRFAPGETEKTFEVPITPDSYSGGAEKFTVKLSNLSGTDIALATPSSATVTINDSAAPAPNAIDDTETFVCMMYHDFLNREPDPAGLAFWMDNIDKCKDPLRRPAGLTVAQCTEVMRINTSAAFFLSIEFQATGNLVRSFYVAALDRPLTNNMPGFVEFERDTQAMQHGVIVGQDGWQQKLDDNRDAFLRDFVTRAEFVGLYPLTDAPWQYVNKLYAHAGIIAGPGDREAAIAEFRGAITAADAGARGRALLHVTQHPTFQDREMNPSFVQMEYFAYLRRNPNDAPDHDCAGYDFWLNKLNAAGGNYLGAEMVRAFLASAEYRCRFGP